MEFNVLEWLHDVIDNNISLKNVRVICDENNTILCGVAYDEKNIIQLSCRDTHVVVGCMANKKNMTANDFLKLSNHSLIEVIKINNNDFIKTIMLIISDDTDIYKIVITNNEGTERIITDKDEQHEVLQRYAKQKGILASQLKNATFNDLEVVHINKVIKNIDVIVDEWHISNGIYVEKIIVTRNDDTKSEYNDINTIKKLFLEFCQQEYCSFNDYCNRVNGLNMANRINLLENLENLPKINIIKPLYERIEIIERSFDVRMSPTKIKIVTSNHGEQIYDLIKGEKVFDSNLKKCLVYKSDVNNNDNLLEIYEMEKRNLLLMRGIENGKYELEKHFFVKYWAEQQLIQEGITKEKIGIENFLVELEKRQSLIASDPTKIVSRVVYRLIEILEYRYDGYGQKNIARIRVKTNSNFFEINGIDECMLFIQKIAQIRNVSVSALLNDNQFVVDSINAINNNSKDKKESKIKFRSIFINQIVKALTKFKKSNFDLIKIKQKDSRR